MASPINLRRQALRKLVTLRPCYYCGAQEKITIDHIQAKSEGGTNHKTNMVACCYDCNQAKSNIPIDRFRWLLQNPVGWDIWTKRMRKKMKKRFDEWDGIFFGERSGYDDIRLTADCRYASKTPERKPRTI